MDTLKQTSVILVIALYASASSAKKASPLSDAELAAITERGRLLAEYDAAVLRSTESVMAMHPEKGSFNQYIARKTDAGWVVAFGRFADQHAKFLVVYEAVQVKAGNPNAFTAKKCDPPQEDTGFNYAAAKAIDTATHDFQGEKRPYNADVLPGHSNQIYVYIMPAQTTRGVYPEGADVRYLMSPDGSTIVEKRPLHKAILEFRSAGTPGRTLAGHFHSHILSDVPEDTDVFYVLNLTRKPPVPEFVGTKNHVYQIQVDGTIHVMK